MINAGFFSGGERAELTRLAWNGSAAHRLARRADALVLPDRGDGLRASWFVLLLDDDMIRMWYQFYKGTSDQEP